MVRFGRFDDRSSRGDDSSADILRDGESVGALTRVMETKWFGMSREYHVGSYVVELYDCECNTTHIAKFAVKDHGDARKALKAAKLKARELLHGGA